MSYSVLSNTAGGMDCHQMNIPKIGLLADI